TGIMLAIENKCSYKELINNQTFHQMYKTSIGFCGDQRQIIFKLVLIMKLVIVLLTTFSLQVGAKGYAQNVTIQVKNASIEHVLQEIQQQTGYDFLYNSAHLRGIKPVNLSFKNTPLITVLEACFAAQPLAFQIDNKTVLVYKKNE